MAPAKALAKGVEDAYGDSSRSFLLNGFSPRMKACRFFFEDGYKVSSNYFEAGYVLFYRFTEIPWAIRFGNYFVSIHGTRHIARFLRDNRITKVVCLHEILIMITRKAIDMVDPSIPLITMVTDPFTAHALWFYEKNMELVVFSEKLRREASERHGFDPKRVHCFPFMFSRAYERPYTAEECRQARARLGIPEDRKVLLIAGGGEGLKSADRIVAQFIKERREELLLVVCGRNKLLRFQVNQMAEWSRRDNIRTFGFVDFMPDLLNVADCVITKGGASTVMEVLAVRKPVIFSTFIRGQELGNVLYVVHHGAGWYIKKPRDILAKVSEVLGNPEVAERVRANAEALRLRNGVDDIVSFIQGFSTHES